MGIPPMADDFRAELKLTSPVWVDTQRLTYKALKFTRGWATVLNTKALFNAVRAFGKGHRQHRAQGDSKLNGGVLVTRKGGECVYAYVSQVSGDIPNTADVLAAARKANSRDSLRATGSSSPSPHGI